MQYRTLSDGRTSFDVSTLCLGAMNFGNRTDEETSRAILDRFVEAGGTFIDTANNYSLWAGGHGRESEQLLGRWLHDRGNRDDVRIATKIGAAQKDPAKPLSNTPPTNFEGLSAEVIRRQGPESARQLGIDRIDVLYGHVDDTEVPLAETVGAFGELQRAGLVGIAGISNVPTWRVVEAREEAQRQGVAPYGVVQQQYSYLYPAPRLGRNNFVTPELLSYAASTGTDERPPLAITVYSPLHQGAIARVDKPLWGGVDHPSSHVRRALLHEVAAELGATANQVALAWLLGAEVPVIPVVGVSSVAQLDEALGAADLVLDAEVRARLDAEPGED
ncbi:aldo/keto reductase [Aneurinibacillus sp. BA2021]|nr:aldo/keto reductase [Aneurinibacillus sp. BA2021]